jgi:hypothetical protein
MFLKGAKVNLLCYKAMFFQYFFFNKMSDYPIFNTNNV